VRVAIELVLHRGDHCRVAMAGVEHRDAAGKIDVAPALDVEHLGVLGPRGEDRVGMAHAAGHGGLAARQQRGIGQVKLSLHVGPRGGVGRQVSCPG
jgi:hypothetical protein